MLNVKLFLYIKLNRKPVKALLNLRAFKNTVSQRFIEMNKIRTIKKKSPYNLYEFTGTLASGLKMNTKTVFIYLIYGDHSETIVLKVVNKVKELYLRYLWLFKWNPYIN